MPWRRRLPRRGNLTTELDIKTHADDPRPVAVDDAIERTCIGFLRCRGVGELIRGIPVRVLTICGVRGPPRLKRSRLRWDIDVSELEEARRRS